MGVNVKNGSKAQVSEAGDEEGVALTKDEMAQAPEVADAIDTAKQDEPPAPDEGDVSTISEFPSSVLIGSGEYQLAYLALEAKRSSGLTTAKWNELTPKERTVKIQAVIDEIDEEEKSSTAALTNDTTVATEDVRVHMDRGVGGRFVAIGGGERVRVAEGSTNGEAKIQDDAELVTDEG
jgi:hypothetical protein